MNRKNHPWPLFLLSHQSDNQTLISFYLLLAPIRPIRCTAQAVVHLYNIYVYTLHSGIRICFIVQENVESFYRPIQLIFILDFFMSTYKYKIQKQGNLLQFAGAVITDQRLRIHQNFGSIAIDSFSTVSICEHLFVWSGSWSLDSSKNSEWRKGKAGKGKKITLETRFFHHLDMWYMINQLFLCEEEGWV